MIRRSSDIPKPSDQRLMGAAMERVRMTTSNFTNKQTILPSRQRMDEPEACRQQVQISNIISTRGGSLLRRYERFGRTEGNKYLPSKSIWFPADTCHRGEEPTLLTRTNWNDLNLRLYSSRTSANISEHNYLCISKTHPFLPRHLRNSTRHGYR